VDGTLGRFHFNEKQATFCDLVDARSNDSLCNIGRNILLVFDIRNDPLRELVGTKTTRAAM
jgi:hypothetical protein